MNPSRLAAIVLATIGGVLLCSGLILGFTGIKKDGVSCGSAFKPNIHDANVRDLAEAMGGYGDSTSSEDCSDATSGRKPVAWALTIPGLLLAVGGGYAFAIATSSENKRKRDEAAAA